MQSLFLDTFLSGAAARAICWTLVHSCWEGILAAALAVLVIGSTRRWPATLRYNLLAADLLLFLLVTAATFGYEIRQRGLTTLPMVRVAEAPGKGNAGNGNEGTKRSGLQQGSITSRQGQERLVQQGIDFLDAQAGTITLIWLACLSLQWLRITGGWYQARRLRREGVAPPGEYWDARVSILARQLGIKRKVTLLQSGRVMAPAALGLFRPLILVPLGVLAQLPPDQVETILLHELAHIRRSDYAANLFLYFTETLFFFNPAVRWIATLIRQERETCCDDKVLAATPDPNSYFEALLAFTQIAARSRPVLTPVALQLDGGKTDLFWRIKRMLDKENRKLQNMEKAILSFGLLVLASVSLISMKEKKDPSPNHSRPVQVMDAGPGRNAVIVDTAPQKIDLISVTSHNETAKGQKKYHASATDDKGNHYEIRKLNDKVTGFKVNGILVPTEQYERYLYVFVAFAAEQERPFPPPPEPASDAPLSAPVPDTHPPAPVPIAPSPASAPGSPLPAPFPATPAQPGQPTQSTQSTQPSQPGQPTQPTQPGQPTQSTEPMEPTQPAQPETAPTLASPLIYTKQPNIYVIMISADLVSLGLIQHPETFSFILDARKLLVNGKKQPSAIFEKFKTKYIRHSRDHFIYSQYYTPKGSGSHCEVNVDDSDSKLTEPV